MALHTLMERLKFVDCLIKQKATGNLTTLAGKLNISRSQTVVFLKQMKEHGFPIKFCRRMGCYFYTEEESLVRNLFQKNTTNHIPELSKNELKKITGGKTISPIFRRADYISMSDGNFIL